EDPVITGSTNGAVTEDTDVSLSGNLSATGTVSFTDVDLADTHSAVTPVSFVSTDGSHGQLGAMTATVSADTTTTGTGGQVNWSYSVADGATDYLSAGQVVTETYKIEVDDNHGGKAFQTVTVTITGTNEDPVITRATNGTVTETPPVMNTGLSTTAALSATADVVPDAANSSVTTVLLVATSGSHDD